MNEIKLFFEKYKLRRFDELELEMILAHHYNAFVDDLQKVYRDNYVLLNSFVGVRNNFVKKNCSKCTNKLLKNVNELKRLLDYI